MKVIPFGDRILVKRRTVGDKIGNGLLHAPETMAERPTDLADVVYVPDNTFGDEEILKNVKAISESMLAKTFEGDSDALIALLRLNEYIKIKSIKKGDCVLISKYVGVDFFGKESNESLTLCNLSDIIGLMKQ